MATWLRVDPKTEERYAGLYSNHRDWVDKVALRMKPHSAALTQPPTGPEDTPYPRRWELTREQVSWQTPVPGYAPEDFTAPEADPAEDKAPNSHPNADANPNPNSNSYPYPYP